MIKYNKILLKNLGCYENAALIIKEEIGEALKF